MQTYHINEYGFLVYKDGELVASFDVEQFMPLIAGLSTVAASRRLPLIEPQKLSPKP